MLRAASRLAALTALVVAALAAQDRVMVGDDIYVGPDESLGSVVCHGCSIRVDGKTRDAVAIGGSIAVNGEVQNAVAIGGSIAVNGAVRDDAVAVAGRVTVESGSVGGDLVSILGGVKLSPGVEVGGDLVAVLGRIEGAEAARIGGTIVNTGGARSWAISGIAVLLVILVVVSLALWPAVTFFVVTALGAARVQVIQETLSRRAAMCFALGFGVWVASILLPMVLFWLPPADFAIGIAFLVVAAVGYAGVSYWVGRGLVRTFTVRGAAVVGALLVSLIQLIPVIGWFIALPIFGFLALGAAVLSGFGTSVDWLVRRAEAPPLARPVER